MRLPHSGKGGNEVSSNTRFLALGLSFLLAVMIYDFKRGRTLSGYFGFGLFFFFSSCSQGHPRDLGSSGFGFVLQYAPECFFGNDFPSLVSPLFK